VQASLELEFRLPKGTGRTLLAASQQEPPLRVVRAFPQEDGSALAHLHNVSGGLLGGDDLRLQVRVGSGASAQITTTGATRIYRPRAEAADTVQRNEITVAEDGLLEYVPDPLIPFAGACFRQHSVIRLAAGAGLFWWEALAPGREARGEVFAYERVAMKTAVLASERLIAAENIALEPARYSPGALARLGPYRYWATFYICQVGRERKFWLHAEETLRECAVGMAEPGETLWGISALVEHGLVVRCLARRGHVLLPGLRRMWAAAKMLIYGRAAIPPRKIN
jgi:urease accessory protein